MKAPLGYFSIIEFMTLEPWQRKMFLNQLEDKVRDPVGTAADLVRSPVDMAGLAAGAFAGPVVRKAKRKKSAYSKRLSKELKKANKAARTKSGRLRKGMTPGKILKKAHKAAKKSVRVNRRRRR